MGIAPIEDKEPRQGPRLLVVPANLGGSVQHFYHFLFGYMLPFVEHCHALRLGHRFVLRDCGPMNRLLRQLDGFSISLVRPHLLLSSLVGANIDHGRAAKLIAPGFDDPRAYRRDRFVQVREAIQGLYGERIAAAAARWPATASDRLVLLVDRAPSLPFYESPAAENPGSGAGRRSVPNMADIQQVVAATADTALVRLEECDLFEQILLFSRAWRVVGQHGAGLAHMIWARPGAGLVEIMPNPGDLPVARVPNVRFFSGICQTLGMGWRPVMQADNHAAIPPTAVLEALSGLN
jgi:hypothetical protein